MTGRILIAAGLILVGADVIVSGTSIGLAAARFFGAWYIGLPLGLLASVHQLGGPPVTLLLLATIVVSDSSQYYTGRAFGRRPLAPAIRLAAAGNKVLVASADVSALPIPPDALEEHLSLLNLVNFGGGCYAVFAQVEGDVVFAGAIGRSDFPNSSAEAMERSLDRFLGLPDDLDVFPGHGPRTSVGRERATNPYLRGR